MKTVVFMVGGSGLNHKHFLYTIIPGVYTPGYGISPLPGFPVMDKLDAQTRNLMERLQYHPFRAHLPAER